jgi:hypothetical protein
MGQGSVLIFHVVLLGVEELMMDIFGNDSIAKYFNSASCR